MSHNDNEGRHAPAATTPPLLKNSARPPVLHIEIQLEELPRLWIFAESTRMRSGCARSCGGRGRSGPRARCRHLLDTLEGRRPHERGPPDRAAGFRFRPACRAGGHRVKADLSNASPWLTRQQAADHLQVPLSRLEKTAPCPPIAGKGGALRPPRTRRVDLEAVSTFDLVAHHRSRTRDAEARAARLKPNTRG